MERHWVVVLKLSKKYNVTEYNTLGRKEEWIYRDISNILKV